MDGLRPVFEVSQLIQQLAIQSINQLSLLSIREAWLPSCPSQRLMFKTYDYIYK